MLSFEKYKADVYSQNGEDGIVSEILQRLKMKRGTAVEFGAADGKYCSNTRRLSDIGWRSFMYDISPWTPEVEKKEITPENVNSLPGCNLLSIDVDGNDFAIWKAYKGKPEIVVIEINSSIPLGDFHFSRERGCSFSLMNKLGSEKGYFLVCHTGNMVFVDRKFKHLFEEVGDSILEPEKFFNKSWLHADV